MAKSRPAPAIEGPPKLGDPPRSIGHRLAWFFGIALASGLSTVLVAYGLEALLPR